MPGLKNTLSALLIKNATIFAMLSLLVACENEMTRGKQNREEPDRGYKHISPEGLDP